MQTAGRKNRSTMDNLIIMNPIIEKQKQDYKNTYILFAEPGMLWQTPVERYPNRDGQNRK